MGFFLPRSAVVTIGFFVLCNVAVSVPNTDVILVLCNAGEYSDADPFAISLAYIRAEFDTATPTSKDYDYYNISPYPNAFAYGHSSCNKNLTSSDCSTCLGAAKTAMFGTCQSRIGARSLFHDCAVRYEQYPFTE